MNNAKNEYKTDADRIYYEWDLALSNNDVEGLMILYAKDAMLESPLVPHLMDTESGVLKGESELRRFFEILATRKPTIRKYYRTSYFTDGEKLIWEYPRVSPEGEQMDFVEVMDLKDCLIHCHRVYWGWRGINVMKDNEYHR